MRSALASSSPAGSRRALWTGYVGAFRLTLGVLIALARGDGPRLKKVWSRFMASA